MRAQKPREGIFGHQTVDPLLGFVKSVCARRVRDAQQSLAGLSVQVHLQRDNPTIKTSAATLFTEGLFISAPTSSGASGLTNWL